MTADRKKPGVAFWATVALLVVLLYPLGMNFVILGLGAAFGAFFIPKAYGSYDELLAEYRKSVVQAFTDVDNALTAWRFTSTLCRTASIVRRRLTRASSKSS